MNASSARPLPRARLSLLDPPTEFTELRRGAPVSKLALPDGSEGWLVSRYADVVAVLDSTGFKAERRGFNNAASDIKITDEELWEAGVAPTSVAMDEPDHARYRGTLTAQFTVRRMRQLTPKIEALVQERLDRIEQKGPGVDLMEEYAFAIPATVICDLLGIPAEGRSTFRGLIETLNRDGGKEAKLEAIAELAAFMRGMVEDKRANPDDGLITALLNTAPSDGRPLVTEELVGLGNLLLIAGHETTANMIGLGTLALLTNRDQWKILRDDPSLIDKAVEELLRYVSIVEFGLLRIAVEDTTIGGQMIHAGEKVIVSLASADRDDDQFDAPNTLDISRPSVRHVGFGWGAHQCLGQQLARLELRIALLGLIQRLPDLEIAADLSELTTDPLATIHGVKHLPVKW